MSSIETSGDQVPPAAASDTTHLQHEGWFSRMKHKAQDAGKTVAHAVHSGEEHARDAAQKGVKAAEKAAHSPQAQQALHTAKDIAKDASKDEVRDVQGAIQAGKRGDVQGVIKHAAPLAEEAALGPHVLIARKAKEEIVKHATGHSSSHSSDADAKEHKSGLLNILPNVHITHDQNDETNQKKNKS